jgi:hypothetical protein
MMEALVSTIMGTIYGENPRRGHNCTHEFSMLDTKVRYPGNAARGSIWSPWKQAGRRWLQMILHGLQVAGARNVTP